MSRRGPLLSELFPETADIGSIGRELNVHYVLAGKLTPRP